MDKLQTARQEINRIDREMAQLFQQRMRACQAVAAYKKEHGLPIEDPAREAEMLEKNAQLVEDPALREFYTLFLQDNLRISKQYQRRLLKGMRVAYSGTEGAFAHIAAGHIFPGTQRVPYGDFRSAYQAVEDGSCDCAVLPLENSYAGEVGQVLDLTFFGPLYINGVYELEIRQHLLGLPGARLSDIKTVVSHPQALGQCADYLHSHQLQSMEFSNTALAAEYVARRQDPSLAAIASAEAGPLHGLTVLQRDINASQRNTTRFGVFSRAQNRALGRHMGDHFILLFTVRNEAGSLARAIQLIGQLGFNLRSLRSRPMKELLWEYYFYLEVEGDIASPQGQEMMRQLSGCCDRVKVAGSFSSHCRLEEETQ